MNMDWGRDSQSSSMNGLSMEEKKKRLKQSIAKMMVFWVAHSRHDLQEDLIGGNPDGAWAGLALKEAFISSKDDLAGLEEWREFFTRASRLFNEEDVKNGARRISRRVHGVDGLLDSKGNPLVSEWEPELDPDCPGERTLNVMYRAAAAFVDSNNW